MLISPEAKFDLAMRVKTDGAPLGEIYSFVSGLYFRGKLTYANHFARSYRRSSGVWIITTNQGLISADTRVTTEKLLSFGKVSIDLKDKTYVQSLQTSASKLADRFPAETEVVLLGSIGTKKYVEILLKVFEKRLTFPIEFVGRGDMSRGGLLLRCVAANQELEYVPLAGAVRHGKRPPKLEPKRWKI
ncbi:MAG: hypothetical protein C5B54_06870 [Acidobacteria bacterium]|nr:MAG: hypothetical protein C5B54_06870 [Acidobacteriota bacterium]